MGMGQRWRGRTRWEGGGVFTRLFKNEGEEGTQHEQAGHEAILEREGAGGFIYGTHRRVAHKCCHRPQHLHEGKPCRPMDSMNQVKRIVLRRQQL